MFEREVGYPVIDGKIIRPKPLINADDNTLVKMTGILGVVAIIIAII